MRTIGIGFLLLVAIALYAVYSAAFTVNEAQQALVLRFGDARDVIQRPGLHWKVPIADNVMYLDDRILDLDSPVQEVIASDQKRLVVDAFARYRIADPLKFYQAVGNIDSAEQRLATILNSALRRVLGEQTFFAVVRDERDELMGEITELVNTEAQNFGIDVVDVRIRRADLPQANSEAIYRRMQTERQQEAAQIRAEGEEQARRIRSSADREATILVAEAQRESEEIRGEGDARRNAIFANAYGRDTGFFDFYRSMQAYERGMQSDSTRFILQPDTDFFRYFGNAAGDGALPPLAASGSGSGDTEVGELPQDGASGAEADPAATGEETGDAAGDTGEAPADAAPADGADASQGDDAGDAPGDGAADTTTAPAGTLPAPAVSSVPGDTTEPAPLHRLAGARLKSACRIATIGRDGSIRPFNTRTGDHVCRTAEPRPDAPALSSSPSASRWARPSRARLWVSRPRRPRQTRRSC